MVQVSEFGTLSKNVGVHKNKIFSFSFSHTFVNFFTLSTEQDIDAFVTFFWSNFPDATFLRKMYNLEKHVVPFLRRQHFPLEFGEQGEKSIHKDFVQLASTFSSC